MARLTKGICELCGEIYTKAGMRRHLESCTLSGGLSGQAGRGRRKTRFLHLVVEGRYLPEYWIHLEVDANATLEDLDDFLRDIWLECCGHLSAFTVEGERYSSDAGEPWFDDLQGKAWMSGWAPCSPTE